MNSQNFAEYFLEEEMNNVIDATSIISSYCDVRNSVLGPYTRLKMSVEFKGSSLMDYSYVSSFSTINATDVGKFCSIAHGVFVGLWEHDREVTTHSFHLFASSGGFVSGFTPYKKDKIRTLVGNDVWIGANAIILKGIHVADGAIVGAGAVVTRNVPPYAIVVGNPAKILKYRLNEEDVKLMLRIQWWDFSRERLQKLVDTGAMSNLEKFKKEIGNI